MIHFYQAAGVAPGAADWRRIDNVKNNEAAGAPTVNDDETLGYETFSRWKDTTGAPDIYELVDPTTGAAVWVLVGLPGDNAETLTLSFGFGDATPEDIGTALANKLILSVSIFITETFDGTSPSLAIGDAGDAERLMATLQNDPASSGGYESHPTYTYGSDTTVRLTITPGAGATQGAGLVVITLQP